MTQPREELRKLVSDLEVCVRVLRGFGVRVCRTRGVAEGKEDATDSPGGYRFGDGRRARWEQSFREKAERGKRGSEPTPFPRKNQATLFGSKEPQPEKTEAQLPVPTKNNPLSAQEAEEKLDAVRQEIGECTRCRLCSERRHVVFGEGRPVAKLAFVGEGPGEEEDRTGRPFVGRAGQLLDKIIAAMGLKREEVYIGNVVKCRPPNNRVPQDDEMRTCGVFLAKQLEIISPSHIVCLGATAAKYLLNTTAPMGKIRGRFSEGPVGSRIMPTYHPAYLLRNPSAKKQVWEDVQKVMTEMQGLRGDP
jgi:uracil-DNA glycosylase